MPDILLLLAQIAGVLVAARLVGRAVALIGQPRVVGEMLAGIMLGPSLLGWAAPGLSHALFPPGSLGFLSALSQIGLVFFMFLVGLELDLRLLRGQTRAAVITSHASIILPFFLGACLALFLYPRLSDDSVSFAGFALFLGAAMSVTAFPVLARMLTEHGMLKTRLGSVTIAAAAVDDVTAWCILAVVIVVVRTAEATVSIPMMLGGTVLYVAAMLTAVRWGLRRLERVLERRGGLSQDIVAIVVFFILASAWTTERLGVHAVFGAFLAGVVMPRDEQLVRPLLDRFQDLMIILFLPLFFAFTGLRTHISLITGDLWIYCALIIAVAVLGKLGGSALAARTSGMSWRDSWAIGTLMNTRGLMELVVLNVGLDIGVISPALFAMMVLMALVTTFMTSPVLARIYPGRLLAASRREQEAAIGLSPTTSPPHPQRPG
ncbi:MAG TPA: cation:proton antiporter [Gemmatimonadales bacterium]|nr:cation:proton antiporter [Gemmatimonadales bacterium]